MWRAWLVFRAVIQRPCLTMAQGMLVAGWHGDVGSGNDQVRSAPGRRVLDVAKPPPLVATRPAARAGGSRAPPGCGAEVVQPYSHIAPQTGKTEDIQTLYKIIFWAALIVFIGVQAAILYTALRFRRRNEERPEQVHGSRKLEIAWTIIPAVILLVLFIPNAQVICKHAAAEQGSDKFDIDVVGKQWWWEFSYRDIPADPNNPDAGPLITANEALIPTGADVVFHVTSNNVIHSFWVPQLSGKVDVIPGHDNPMQFVASTPGDYYGECAEFCGAAHAWMRFKVKVVPEENFDD